MTVPRRVLLVEDNPDEVELARIALARCHRRLEVSVATDGRQALDMLAGPAPAPELMLLDINMPVLDGFGVLEAMGAHAEWRRIPVVVLTTSNRPADLVRAQSLGARAVHTKAADFAAFTAGIAAIVEQFVPAARA